MAEVNVASPELLSLITDQLRSQRVTNGSLDSSFGYKRVPFTMTCSSWQKRAEPKYIVWKVNPGDTAWTLGQRSSEQKTRMGTVLHVWKDNIRGTYYDEPILDINFQSGSIMPVRSENGQVYRINTGLKNFYEFLSLVDEQKINADGTANMIHITYSSNIFPVMVLSGLFSPEGTSWNDTSQEPYDVSGWRARFTVRKTYPAIGRNQAELLVNSFESAVARLAMANKTPTEIQQDQVSRS